MLGRGGFGVVNGCKKNNTGHLYAMKVMNKRRIKSKNAQDLCWNERIVLGKVDSPFVISLKYAFATEEDVYLILDLATGGDLAFHLAKEVRFTEDRARFYAAQLLLGLEHLHSLDIVYRDMKVRLLFCVFVVPYAATPYASAYRTTHRCSPRTSCWTTPAMRASATLGWPPM